MVQAIWGISHLGVGIRNRFSCGGNLVTVFGCFDFDGGVFGVDFPAIITGAAFRRVLPSCYGIVCFCSYVPDHEDTGNQQEQNNDYFYQNSRLVHRVTLKALPFPSHTN